MLDFLKILGDTDTLQDAAQMKQAALDAEAVKDWPRAMLAWERVIDRCQSTPQQRYEAYGRIKQLRWNVPPVNTDPAQAMSWKTLGVMYRHVEWSWTDKDGMNHHVRTTLNDSDQKRIEASMRSFAHLAFKLTDGILRIDPEFVVIEKTISQLSVVGNGRFWMEREVMQADVEKAVAGKHYDCVIAYPKFTDSAEVSIPKAYGADACGGDAGPGGVPFIMAPYSAIFTYPVDGELELHEWLHHTHMIVMRLLGYPDGVDVNPDLCPREIVPGGDPNFFHPTTDAGFFMRYYEYMMQIRYTRLMWAEMHSKNPPRVFWGGRYVKDWLLAGPFTAQTGSAMETDFIGEKAVKPQLDAQAAGKSWVRVNSLHGKVQPDSLIGKPAGDQALYLATAVACGPDKCTLLLGSAGDLKVWLNGTEVFARQGKRPLVADQDRVEVQMKGGLNQLLFKLGSNGETWGLQARVLDGQGVDNWGMALTLPS